MKLIVGLGNPGDKYRETRHNAGYEVIDLLSKEQEIICDQFAVNKRFFAETARAKFLAQDLLLVKPLTFMNESGKTVVAIRNFFKVELSDLLVIHDDVSLPLGRVRLQKHGGAGGQHGVESIISCLSGDNKFDRLKIGIGPDPGGELRAHYVLQKFSKDEQIILNQVLQLATRAVISWLMLGIEQAMNDFNGQDLR